MEGLMKIILKFRGQDYEVTRYTDQMRESGKLPPDVHIWPSDIGDEPHFKCNGGMVITNGLFYYAEKGIMLRHGDLCLTPVGERDPNYKGEG